MNDQNSKERYADYLTTDYWKAVVLAVKERAGYRCQVCNSQHDLQAHHRCYDHRGKELDFLSDLTCLCRRCHGIFHGTIQTAAPAPNVEPRAHAMVLITEQNYKGLRPTKEPWHWMMANGINPKKAGWSRRAIGFEVPAHWMNHKFYRAC